MLVWHRTKPATGRLNFSSYLPCASMLSTSWRSFSESHVLCALALISSSASYRYGLYTLMVCVIGMLLILLLGRDTLADYCLFIPVYTTGASFLTIAWPSLLESVGYQPGTIQDLLDPYNLPCPLVPLDSISIDTIPSNQAVSGFSSQTEWRHGPIRLTGSPTPFTQLQSVPALSERIAGEEPSGVLVSEVVPQDIRFMRPSSSASSHRADTMSSISLSSRASWPSEMSSIVLPFFSPPDPTRLPRQTSRRRDIEALGRRQSDFSLPQPLMSMPMSTAAT